MQSIDKSENTELKMQQNNFLCVVLLLNSMLLFAVADGEAVGEGSGHNAPAVEFPDLWGTATLRAGKMGKLCIFIKLSI